MAVPHLAFENACIELVIFDCDGVLIDSEVLSKRILLAMLEELHVCVSDDYFDSYFLGRNYAAVKARIYADFKVVLSEDFRQHYLTTLLQVFTKELRPTAHLEELLFQLKVRSCVATSSSPERVTFALKTTGLAQYFDGRVFTSSEVENGKPAPDIFLHAASKFGVAPRNCLVIEDSQVGIMAALAAKMHVIKYAGASHLKHKGVSQAEIINNIDSIFDWRDLYKLARPI